MHEASEAYLSGESERSQMKIKRSSLLLAIVLATAGSAFADSITADSNVELRGFASTALYSQKANLVNDFLARNSDMRIFREGKVAPMANAGVQIGNFIEEGIRSETGVLLGSREDSVEHNESLAEFASKSGRSFGWNDDRGEKHSDRDSVDEDSKDSAIAVSESGTRTLVLVGVLFSALMVFRQSATRTAI
jgi:hypothetical protein